MKWIVIAVSNLAVAGIVAFLCLGTANVEAQPVEYSYQAGYDAGYTQGYGDHVEYREVVAYVDREVVREVTVNQTVALRDFASTEEMEAWLAADDTSEFVYFTTDAQGNPVTDDSYDCDDYARQLQRRAAEAGYQLSVTLVRGDQGLHMVNLAVIDGSVYYVEPQTDEYWFYCNLD